MFIKKNISKLLKLILPKTAYLNRRDNKFFILYSNFEFFIKTLKYRSTNFKFIFLPSKHIGAILLLNKISKFFNEKRIDFFLWDACLLGAIRKQNAIAGSALDIDIGIIFDKKKHLKTLLFFKEDFKLKFHNNYNALQLFHSMGVIDISLFRKKNSSLEITTDVALSKETNTYNKNNYVKKNFLYRFSDFFPFKSSKIYSKNFLIPKNSIFLLKRKYGSNWKSPIKKKQVYFT